MTRPSLTVIAFGDSITQGIGDETELGWLHRISAELHASYDVTTYNLGVRGNTSLDLSRRFESELRARIRVSKDIVMVLCIGTNDTAEYRGQLRVPQSHSLQLTHRIVQTLLRFGQVLWISPLPVGAGGPGAAEQEIVFELEPGETFAFREARLSALNTAFRELAVEMGVPYLDLFEQWSSLSEHFVERPDGIHPTSRGYVALADAISAWPAWRAAISH